MNEAILMEAIEREGEGGEEGCVRDVLSMGLAMEAGQREGHFLSAHPR